MESEGDSPGLGPGKTPSASRRSARGPSSIGRLLALAPALFRDSADMRIGIASLRLPGWPSRAMQGDLPQPFLIVSRRRAVAILPAAHGRDGTSDPAREIGLGLYPADSADLLWCHLLDSRHRGRYLPLPAFLRARYLQGPWFLLAPRALSVDLLPLRIGRRFGFDRLAPARRRWTVRPLRDLIDLGRDHWSF